MTRADVPTPTIVLMAGLPGSGKTTLALALGRALGWPVIDKDTLKTAMLAAGVAEAIAGPAGYELMFDLGRDLVVGQRLSAILDSPAAYPICTEKALEIALAAGARLKVVLCLADPPTRNRRLAQRAARLSQLTADNPATGDGRARFTHLPGDTLILQTVRPLDALIAHALAYVLQDE
jgi:predicted kinase